MEKMSHYLHPKQILTTWHGVRRELSWCAHAAIHQILLCFTEKVGSPAYKNHVVAAAMYLDRASCPVYRAKDGEVKKLPEKEYRKEIFEWFAETPEEIHFRLKDRGVTERQAALIHKMVWQIADLVCPPMANTAEQLFLSEYAYAIDYVIRHKGKLEKAVVPFIFPANYPDYHYQEGIAAEVFPFDYM